MEEKHENNDDKSKDEIIEFLKEKPDKKDEDKIDPTKKAA